MLNRKNLESLFNSKGKITESLNFSIESSVSTSKAIRNREIATIKSLENESLDVIAGLEGSPPFIVLRLIVKTLYRAKLIPPLAGIGLEMGSGLGLLSCAIISEDKNGLINGILAIEAGAPFIEKGINITSKTILGNNSYKVMPCYGSFDSIGVESESIDFVFQIEALHHAEKLAPPIIEAYRILKNGGYFISIDRSWPNKVKNDTLKELLDHEYSKEWLEAKGFPTNGPFRRRDNGEHEYLDSDWDTAFKNAGFQLTGIKHLHPELNLKHLLKRVLTLFRLNLILGIKVPSRSGIFRATFSKFMRTEKFRLFPVVETTHPRPLTVTVWVKNN